MQYKLTIPGRLPGLNELIEAERANRYKGAQLKKDAERRICAEMRRLQKAGALLGEGWCTDEKRRNDFGRM